MYDLIFSASKIINHRHHLIIKIKKKRNAKASQFLPSSNLLKQ